MARTDPIVNFRFKSSLIEALRASAAANGRSLTAEVAHRLERSLGTSGEAAALDSAVADLINRHIETEVRKRLAAIASQITGEQ